MLEVKEFPDLTPEQAREIDNKVDEGVGNYGEVLAKVIGIDVFSPDFKNLSSQEEPVEPRPEQPKDQLTI